jgi:hypothetical protein
VALDTSGRLGRPTATPTPLGHHWRHGMGPPTWTGACGRGARLARPSTAENGSLTCANQAGWQQSSSRQQLRRSGPEAGATRQRFVSPHGIRGGSDAYVQARWACLRPARL